MTTIEYIEIAQLVVLVIIMFACLSMPAGR